MNSITLRQQVEVADLLRTMMTEGADGLFAYTATGIRTDEDATQAVRNLTGISLTKNNLTHVRIELIGKLRKNTFAHGPRATTVDIMALRDEIDGIKAMFEAQQEETINILSRLNEAENTIVRAMHSLSEVGQRVDKLSAFKGAGYATKEHG